MSDDASSWDWAGDDLLPLSVIFLDLLLILLVRSTDDEPHHSKTEKGHETDDVDGEVLSDVFDHLIPSA